MEVFNLFQITNPFDEVRISSSHYVQTYIQNETIAL